MLLMQTLLTGAFFAAVWWVRRGTARARRSGTLSDTTSASLMQALPEADQAPATAVGWPPRGRHLSRYVADGCRELEAYLTNGDQPTC